MTSLNYFKNETYYLSYPPGQAVFREGEPGDVMYVVKEGEVDILVGGRVVETVGPGGMIGEMALLEPSTRSATAKAKSACKLIPVNQERFVYLVQETPFFALQVMRIMAERLRRMNQQIL